jgi:hypothetical protein
MPILRLIYRARTPLHPSEAALSIFESSDLGHAYFPGRGIPFSLLFHGILFCVITIFRVSHLPPVLIQPPRNPTTIDRNEPLVVLYLPVLGSGSPGTSLPAAKEEDRPTKPSVASTPGKKGLSYPGRQPILSDPLKPTNKIQTLLQPGLKDLPILAPPLALPNLVQLSDSLLMAKLEPAKPVAPEEPTPPKPPEEIKPMASPPPKPPKEAKIEEPPPANMMDLLPAKAAEIQPELPAVKVAPPTFIEEPKLVLPTLPPMPEPKPPEPLPKEEPPAPKPQRAEVPAQKTSPLKETKPVEASQVREAPPKTEPSHKKAAKSSQAAVPEPSPLSVQGSDLMDLLALSPVPAPAKLPVKVPVGEARGRFAISPLPNLTTSDTEPGLRLEIPSPQVGLGTQTAPAGKEVPDNIVPDTKIGVSSGAAKSEDSKGAGTSLNAASSSKMGSAAGTGTGSGTGSSTSSGKGPGTGVGKRPFSGITIVGGSYDPGIAPNPVPVVQAPRPLQGSYGVTVISTENSGGGLPFVGVFSHEQIYTVYLDMRRMESDPAPSWTLEFAVLKNSSDPLDLFKDSNKSQEGLVLPFPIVKEPPALPEDLVRKHLRELVLVYAIINVKGKMEQISVKESPDTLLNEPLVRALSKWVFRPAQLQGEPVAVKALLGIPLWIPQ